MKDEVTVSIDTSGESLHRRGYRKLTSGLQLPRPLRQHYNAYPMEKGPYLVDPFCGSGTIPIEAALIGARIAPGIQRLSS